MNFSHREISALVQRVKLNDSQAFTLLYEKTYHAIHFLTLSILKNEYDAQDAAQETYIQILASIDTLEDEKLFIAWANRIAYHICVQMMREYKDVPTEDELLTAPPEFDIDIDPLTEMIQNEEKRRVFQSVQKLEPVLRATVFFRYFQNMKIREIAMIMDCPVGTVKSRLHTAKKQLLVSMSKDGSLTLILGLFSMVPLRGICHEAGMDAFMSSQAAFGLSENGLLCQGLSMPCVLSSAASATTTAASATAAATTAAKVSLSTGLRACIIASVSTVSVAAVAVSSLVLAAPSISQITISEGYVSPTATVTVEAESHLPITELYAVAPDGNKIYAQNKENGLFELLVNENGNYEVIAVSENKKQAAQTVFIDCIDRTAPEVLSYSYENEILRMIFSDTQSGLDLTTVYGELSNGTQIFPFSVDSASDSVLFSTSTDSFILYISDAVGNTSINEVILTRE